MVLEILQDKFYTILFFAAGIGAFFYGFMALRRKRMVENIPTSKIRSLAMGLVEISGTAGCGNYKGQILCSPLTGVPCAYFDFTVSVFINRGKRSSWETISSGKSDIVPFTLTDETGTVNILPKDAEITIKPTFREMIQGKKLPDNLRSFMERHNLTKHFDRHLLFIEHRINNGQQIYVLGTAAKAGDAIGHNTKEAANTPAGISRDPATQVSSELSDVIIRKGENDEVFLITDVDQEAFRQQLSYEAFGFTVGGAIVSLFTLWSLVSHITKYYK